MKPDYSNIQPFAVIYHSTPIGGHLENNSFANMDGMFSDAGAKNLHAPITDSILNDSGNKPYKPLSKADTSKACAAILKKIQSVKEQQATALANGDNVTVGQLNILYLNLMRQYEHLCPKKPGTSKTTYSNFGEGVLGYNVLKDPSTGQLTTETSVAAKSNDAEKKGLYDWVSLGLGAAASIFGKKDSTSTGGGTTNVVVQAADKPSGVSPMTIGLIVLGVAVVGGGLYFVFKK